MDFIVCLAQPHKTALIEFPLDFSVVCFNFKPTQHGTKGGMDPKDTHAADAAAAAVPLCVASCHAFLFFKTIAQQRRCHHQKLIPNPNDDSGSKPFWIFVFFFIPMEAKGKINGSGMMR